MILPHICNFLNDKCPFLYIPIRDALWFAFFNYYRAKWTRIAKRKVRKAEKQGCPIKVAFMMYELPFWKNEALFKALIQNEKFSPAFWITDNPVVENDEIQREIKSVCIKYAKDNDFPYYQCDSIEELRAAFSPDYLFVVHPYDNHIPFEISDLKDELLCFIPYGYSNLSTSRVYGGQKLQLFYRVYLESKHIQDENKVLMKNEGVNTRVTGLPMAALLLSSRMVTRDESNKKKVIWAPHWTVGTPTYGLMDTSSFLEFADKMLELLKKYSDSVFFIFKPHPLLKRTLYEHPDWGKEKTDKYYNVWSSEKNASLEEGDYGELFKASDALIHDCGSFILEYLLMNKPCLYLFREDFSPKFNKSTLSAMDCHYKAHHIDEIELFINMVINGDDSMKAKRTDFLHSYLLPDGKSPVENIIEDLLNP